MSLIAPKAVKIYLATNLHLLLRLCLHVGQNGFLGLRDRQGIITHGTFGIGNGMKIRELHTINEPYFKQLIICYNIAKNKWEKIKKNIRLNQWLMICLVLRNKCLFRM